MAREMHLHSTGDKLPESTGEMVQLSWGNFLDCIGEMAPLGCPYFAGEQSYISVEEY